jgi:hypothetical protein
MVKQDVCFDALCELARIRDSNQKNF